MLYEYYKSKYSTANDPFFGTAKINCALRIKFSSIEKESALVRGKDEGKDYDIGLLGDLRNIGVRIFRSMLLSAANGPLLTATGVNDRKLLIKAMKGSSRSVCAPSRLQLI